LIIIIILAFTEFVGLWLACGYFVVLGVGGDGDAEMGIGCEGRGGREVGRIERKGMGGR
jgi:hypothetical protein